MFSSLIKNLSILKKFLFINLLIFIFIGTLTIIYLNYVQPNLIKKKTSLQIEVINNTINNLNRLNIEFEKNEVKKFLLSTRFLFQNLDRVVFFNESFEILADTDTLDLDPRSFSSRIEIVEFDLQNNQDKEKSTDELIDSKKKSEFEEILEFNFLPIYWFIILPFASYACGKSFGPLENISADFTGAFVEPSDFLRAFELFGDSWEFFGDFAFDEEFAFGDGSVNACKAWLDLGE